MKILIVDDSYTIVLAVKQMLIDAGHEVMVATDGKKAIEFVARDETIDLILLDWYMPNLSGLDFLKYNFSQNITSSQVIMMTSENKPNHIKQALNFGASEYIMKPFTQDILMSKIQIVFDTAA